MDPLLIKLLAGATVALHSAVQRATALSDQEMVEKLVIIQQAASEVLKSEINRTPVRS
jgi:hypothetical protein